MTYRFDVLQLHELYERYHVPQLERKDYSLEDEEVRCTGCLYWTSYLYVQAGSREEAERMLVQGGAGLCAACYADLLAETTPDGTLQSV